MSRLAKHLVPIDTGRRFADVPTMSTLSVQEGVCEVPHLIAREYRLEVRLGASALVGDDIAKRADPGLDIFGDAIRVTRRKIIEEVFGEFRPLIYKINEALHQRDWAEANRLTGQLYQQMFEEGV